MGERAFTIVDVFAEEKYAGNQLAVVRNAYGLSDAEMQRIAQEMHFSETTFVLSDQPRDGGYDVRIFTPAEEVPFAGHPTLGTAFVIRQEMVGEVVDEIVLNLQVGRIPVSWEEDGGIHEVLWMRQREPEFGRTLAAEAVAPVLGLTQDQIEGAFPIQEVSTGLPFIICPLKSLDALKQIRVVRESLLALVATTEAKAILAFCAQSRHPSNHLSARVFTDYFGIPEDPATGSANGCLAAYLAKYRFLGRPEVDVRVEQGYEIGRPSLLRLQARDAGRTVEVRVGGRVIPVARGLLV
jgi:trans-2,3-dihydro-3-hydroxyanthranilate isomerase